MLDAVLEPEDGPTSDRKSARRQRIEVITRGERRRRWTVEQKRDMALESLEPGTSPTIVARKHGISSASF
jgi:transposase